MGSTRPKFHLGFLAWVFVLGSYMEEGKRTVSYKGWRAEGTTLQCVTLTLLWGSSGLIEPNDLIPKRLHLSISLQWGLNFNIWLWKPFSWKHSNYLIFFQYISSPFFRAKLLSVINMQILLFWKKFWLTFSNLFPLLY
jgi:hypothetical protein